jgi:membrane-associated phospholipid phosphatase
MIHRDSRRSITLVSSVCLALVFVLPLLTSGQTPDPNSATKSDSQTATTTNPTHDLEKKFFKNILSDQGKIWTSPFHLARGDSSWAIPLTISAVALIATDRHTSSELVENGDDPDRLRISRRISQFGSIYTTGGVALSFYLVGLANHNTRARETGLLAAEALINGGIVSGVLKGVSQRQRPSTDNSSGEFFDGGSSFPSGHAVSVWSVATVIADEYGKGRPAVRIGLYGLASAVSISRYTGRNHFLSDVLIGSAIGYGIGHFVYKQHHDVALDSENEKLISGAAHSKWIPEMTPQYNPRAHLYGARLAWEF